MSGEFTCGDPAGLAGYVYDECEPAERAAIEAHLTACSSCALELKELRATRTVLASWTPPEAQLGFTITSERRADERAATPPGRVLTATRWWQRPLPAWAQAAAALLIFAAGLSAGMRTGASRAAPPEPTAPAAAATSAASAADLAALERRLRAEMTAVRTSAAASAERASVTRPPQAADAEALLQRVRALVAESEERQERELAVRLAQVLRDVDAQRRVDLRRIEQTFGQMEGFTRPELANQRQWINYLIRTTGARAPQE